MPGIQSGELDQRIILQSPTQTNQHGAVTKAWVTVASVWAKVISQRGDEAFQAARDNASETLRILVRYRDDVQTSWRLQWYGQDYNISSVDRSQRRDGKLWLTAKVVGAL